MCEDFALNFGDKRAMHHLTFSFSPGNFSLHLDIPIKLGGFETNN
jgi:hypothetical protein